MMIKAIFQAIFIQHISSILINTKNSNDANYSLRLVLFGYFAITTRIPMASCNVPAARTPDD